MGHSWKQRNSCLTFKESETMLAGPGRKPAHINQKYRLLAFTSVWDYLNTQIEGALGKLSIYTAKTSQQCDLRLQEQYKLYYFSFNSELPSCNKLIFKVLPNPTHSMVISGLSLFATTISAGEGTDSTTPLPAQHSSVALHFQMHNNAF